MAFKNQGRRTPPVCRLELNGLAVDVMVPDPSVLGHNAEWFAEAYDCAGTFVLPSGLMVRAITPPYFLATKLAAFSDRGGGAFIGSKDIEDIINLIAAYPALLKELKDGHGPVFTFIKERLASFLDLPEFEDANLWSMIPSFLGTTQNRSNGKQRARVS